MPASKSNSRLAENPKLPNTLYRLKRRWRDGTTHMIFEPIELVERLAALVPPPRFNLVRYYGVLASGSSLWIFFRTVSRRGCDTVAKSELREQGLSFAAETSIGRLFYSSYGAHELV